MDSFNSKLKKYALLTAGVTIAGVKVAKSQVRYTDLNPDELLSSSDYSLDLDQDGSGDFDVENYQYYYYSYYSGTTFTNNNNWLQNNPNTQFIRFNTSVNRADKLDLNDVIANTNLFTTTGFIRIGSNNSLSYAWTGNETDKYLGVKIVIGGQDHFGWVRMSTGIDNVNLTIHDFAYNTIPGQQIMAGFTGQPVIAANTGLTAPHAGSVVITPAMLDITDPDHIADSVKINMTALPLNGQFENSNNPGIAITSFRQQNIVDGLISYIHNGSATTSDMITFSIQGSLSTPILGNTLNINIVDATAPTITVNAGGTVDNADTLQITTALLSATDDLAADANITFTVSSGPLNGQLENTDTPATPITSFTQADLVAGKIEYIHDGTVTTDGTFSFTVDDGAGNSTTSTAFVITVNSTVGIGNNDDLSSSISAFPNPTKGDVVLNIENDITGNLSIQVINILGATIIENEYTKSSFTKKITLDANLLESGTYIIKVIQKDKEGILKVIKD